MNAKKAISQAELKNLLASDAAKLKVIDIRTAAEFDKLHIPVAENIDTEDLKNKWSSFSKDDMLVCVCNKGHERSQNAAEFLFNNGFENTFYLEGGTLGWFPE
ncbi:MAG: rhodanese-like domain-containing protein [Panacibacter sp.]